VTTEEVTYVQENWNLVLRYFISFVSRYPDLNKLERYVENIAANARDAQSRYNRGLRLAVDP
jgi:transposase-like protein